MIKPTSEQIKVKRALSAMQNAAKEKQKAKAHFKKRKQELDEALSAGYDKHITGIPALYRDIASRSFELDYDRLHEILTGDDPLDAAPYETSDLKD